MVFLYIDGSETVTVARNLEKKLIALGVRKATDGTFPVIVTNAHVVHGMRSAKFQFNDSSTFYPVEPLCFFHARDLAILIPSGDDIALTDQLGALALPVSTKPISKSDTLTVYGYPVGGKQVAETEGKLSRILAMTYAHSSLPALGYEMTTTINHGNSGGPVLVEDPRTQVKSVVAISHQAAKNTSNQFHSIPVIHLVAAFREWFTYGKEFGLTCLPISTSDLKHPAIRAYYGLNVPGHEEHGTLISGISGYYSHPQDADPNHQFKINDVLLSINGLSVDTEHNVRLLGERISYACYLGFVDPGSALTIKVLRRKSEATPHDFEECEFQLRSVAYQSLLRAYRLPSQKQPPTFYQHGLIFSGEINKNTVLSEFDKEMPSALSEAVQNFGGFRTNANYAPVIFYPRTDTTGYSLSEINVFSAISLDDGKTIVSVRDVFHLWHLLNASKSESVFILLYHNSMKVPFVVLPKLSALEEKAHRKTYSVPEELSPEKFAERHLPKNARGWQCVHGLVNTARAINFFKAERKKASSDSKTTLIIESAASESVP